jgi:Na+-transporting methylmalonyl-CoA/oxaloacetate decarboxylase gamma subunit
VAAQQDSENHWPGYVDALTTMTMMLIFIMTILAVAIFGMSQNVSRSVVEKIAKAAKIDINTASNESVDDIANRVMAQLERQPDGGTRLAQAPLRGTSGTAPETERIASASESAQAADDGKVRVDAQSAAITIAYRRRATELDDDARARMRRAIEAKGSERVVIRAYADRTGAVSDARRVAYYRLLKLRTQMIAMGIAADRIDFGIEDTVSPDTGDLVRINLAGAG